MRPGLAVALPAFALWMGLAVPPAANAGRLDVVAPGAISVYEGGQTVQLSWTVTNNTGFNLILDFALATITSLSTDPDDRVTFAGAGGANGLASAPTTLLKGETQQFTYNFQIPTDTEAMTDPGRNNVDFFLEMSQYPGGPLGIPKFLPAAAGFLFLVNTNGAMNPVTLNSLKNFMPPPGNPANPGGVPNTADALFPLDNPFFGVPYPASSAITVLDTPEPATLVGLAIGGAASLRRLRRRSGRRG